MTKRSAKDPSTGAETNAKSSAVTRVPAGSAPFGDDDRVLDLTASEQEEVEDHGEEASQNHEDMPERDAAERTAFGWVDRKGLNGAVPARSSIHDVLPHRCPCHQEPAAAGSLDPVREPKLTVPAENRLGRPVPDEPVPNRTIPSGQPAVALTPPQVYLAPSAYA